jgi:hypothetical protein
MTPVLRKNYPKFTASQASHRNRSVSDVTGSGIDDRSSIPERGRDFFLTTMSMPPRILSYRFMESLIVDKEAEA